MLRIHKFLPLTRVEGPGDRASIWVQGCPIRCKGCAVPWTWPNEGGHLVSVERFSQRILDGPKVEGVTFLGGEPFAQAAGLAELGGILQNAGLSVMTFTGYLLESIKSDGRPEWLRLLGITDLLIDGPYIESCADLSRPWVGSSNQRFHFLTDRYRHLEKSLLEIPNRVEIRILPSGEMSLNGMIGSEDLQSLTEAFSLSEEQATAKFELI